MFRFAAIVHSAAVALALGLAAAPASAQPAGFAAWTDPTGKFTVQRPAAWPVEQPSGSGEFAKDYVAGTADEECWFTDVASENTATATDQQVVRAYAKPLSNDAWRDLARTNRVFNGAEPGEVVSATVEQAFGVPTQLARISHPKNGMVIAALYGRKGFEVHVMCVSYDGEDRTEKFLAVARGVTTTGDDALRAAAAADAAAAAAAAEPAPKGKQ